MHCADIWKLRSIYGRVAHALEQTLPCTGAPSASGKRLRNRLRATSPAWCQCSSCSTYVGVSGDGMQEPPNESDASVSTLIIVLSLLVLFYITCTVYFYKCRYERAGAVFNVDTDIGSKLNQSNNTEHKFGGWRHCTQYCVAVSSNEISCFSKMSTKTAFLHVNLLRPTHVQLYESVQDKNIQV